MLVLLNTQNRHQSLISSLLSINIPILITEALTYPFLKLQSQLLSNNSPISVASTKYHFQYLLKQQGYPKILQGIRYSLDHSITYATFRFLILDQFIQGFQRFNLKSIPLAIPVLSSIGFATLISQPSFVQRTVSSSLSLTDYQTITSKMKSLDLGKTATTGIKYSLMINLLSTSLDMGYLYLFQKQIRNSISIELLGGVIASIVVSIIIHPLHHLRVIQINQKMLDKIINKPKNILSLFQGVGTSIIRRGINNSLLFGMYLWYNFHSQQKRYHQGVIREQLMQEYEKKMEDDMKNNMRKSRGN